jgi:hypothetical protein
VALPRLNDPLTRHVVHACPFDREAELIFLSQFVDLANETGLQIHLKRYIVFFARFLSSFRRIEPFLGFLPLDAQYLLLLGLDE